MPAGNHYTAVGNATKDPELKFTPSGTAVASFGLAVNRRWMNRQTEEWEEAVAFIDITVWGQQAENCAQSIERGMRVLVEGRIDQDNWKDKQTGDNRSKLKVTADEVCVSLRWANAQVEKNERRGPEEEGGSSKSKSKPDYDPDERPF